MLLSMGYESLYYSIAHYFQQKLSMNLIHPATRVARWYALHASSNATLQLCTTKPLSGQRNTEHPAEVFSSLHPKNITDGVASREDFGSIRLHPALKNGLEKMKIHSPTLVQEKSWDPVFQGRSTLITAETGTGKTLAFALPIIQRLIANQGTSQPFSTVCLVPTRELAVQVHNVFVSLLNEVMGDKAVQYTHCVVKGMERSTVKKQLRKLKREKPSIIVATPSRFLELLDYLPMADEVQTVVLDEADKLLDPLSRHASDRKRLNRERHPRPTTDILDQIIYNRKFPNGEDRRPYAHLARTLQIVGASATLTAKVKREIIQRGWSRPKSIELLSLSDGYTLPSRLNHLIVDDSFCLAENPPIDTEAGASNQGENLFQQLQYVLSATRAPSTLVFVPTSVPVKETTERIREFCVHAESPLPLSNQEPNVTAIAVYEHVHEAQSPHDAHQRRAEMLSLFENATPQAPVVGVMNMDAVRGIDIPRVNLACLVGTPRTHIDYLHIAGRVGRNGEAGTVVVFAYDALQRRRCELMAKKLNLRMSSFPSSETRT